LRTAISADVEGFAEQACDGGVSADRSFGDGLSVDEQADHSAVDFRPERQATDDRAGAGTNSKPTLRVPAEASL
jgi:hypothetical protein